MMAFVGYGGLLLMLHPTSSQLPHGEWWTWLQADPERGLLLGAASIGWLLAAWLFVVTGLSLAATTATAGGRLAGRLARLLTPLVLRRVLEAVLGAALAVGPAGAALAGPSPSPARIAVTLSAPAPVPAPIVAPPELSIPDLDRPFTVPPAHPPAPPASKSATTTPAPTASPPATPTPTPIPTPTTTPTPPATATPARNHRVVPGDTLWDLAGSQLPSGSSAAAITQAWQQWYAANRATIGADPALLLPGQLLAVPRMTS